MSIPVMSQVWRTHLPLRGKFVLLAMADFADKFGRKVFPTVGTICKKTSMSESAVHRALHELRGKGFLIETKKARYGRGTEYMIPSSAPQGSPNPPKRVPKPAPERPVDGRADGSTSGTSGVPPAGPNPPMNHQEYINTTSPVVPKEAEKNATTAKSVPRNESSWTRTRTSCRGCGAWLGRLAKGGKAGARRGRDRQRRWNRQSAGRRETVGRLASTGAGLRFCGVARLTQPGFRTVRS